MMSNLGTPIGDAMGSIEERLIANSLNSLEEPGVNDSHVDELDPELVLQQILENPALSQHVTRTVEEDRETVIGYYRVGFSPKQLRQVLHVSFSPPLRSLPTIEAHATDSDGIRIRVTDTQKFGVRIEIIRSTPNDNADQVLVEVIATES